MIVWGSQQACLGKLAVSLQNIHVLIGVTCTYKTKSWMILSRGRGRLGKRLDELQGPKEKNFKGRSQKQPNAEDTISPVAECQELLAAASLVPWNMPPR